MRLSSGPWQPPTPAWSSRSAPHVDMLEPRWCAWLSITVSASSDSRLKISIHTRLGETLPNCLPFHWLIAAYLTPSWSNLRGVGCNMPCSLRCFREVTVFEMIQVTVCNSNPGNSCPAGGCHAVRAQGELHAHGTAHLQLTHTCATFRYLKRSAVQHPA